MRNFHIIQLLCTFIICNLHLTAYCANENIFKMKQVTVNKVLLGDEPEDTVVYYEPEDRQKLCFYAAIKAKLPWVDFSYVPFWQKNRPMNYGDSYYYGMFCKGIPNFYLLRELYKRDIEIRVIKSPFEHCEFDTSNMMSVKSVTLRDDLSEEFEDTALANLKLDDRKNLCALALKHTENHFHFVDGDVGTAEPYEFKYKDKEETNIAILCPTSPELYLCPGKSSNEVKLLLFKSGIDLYEFEKDDLEARAVSPVPKGEQSESINNTFEKLNSDDRIKLCTLARQWNGITTLDTDRNVTEAQEYEFKYAGNETEERNITILCPLLPTLYLRLVGEYKIKLTFAQLEPNFHVSGIEVVKTLFTKRKEERTPEQEVKLQHHSFTGLDDETRWRLCHMGQKYILQSEKRIDFKFTTAEDVLAPFRLLMTPNSRSMHDPDLYEIVYSTGREEEDIAYECARWPTMYIRLGTSTEEIKIILLRKQLSNP